MLIPTVSESRESISLAQHPPHSSPHSHRPSGHPQPPEQPHSSGGSETSPKATPRSSRSFIAPRNNVDGYTVTFVASKAAVRVRGGRGSDAARARNASINLDVDELELSPELKAGPADGNSIPPSLSTQVPHPSSQSLKSSDTCSAPRCSTHPGQEHCKPQQHPEPASDAIVLSGGMSGNVGDGEAPSDADVRELLYGYRIGGRSGPLVVCNA
ncbi:hypothetical protein AcV7_000177 [Taiwanofungus camphoratus]|nr:hypothetical protein AcW2_001348 [Antrodia cinnamomea]KAI0960940.1 hypothetical protein AcV7_000177 [Antrodia cinnamomea]